MGSTSITKGKTFERWVAAALRELLRLPREQSRRGVTQSRGGGAEVPDVEVHDLPIHFECKHAKKITHREALRQAVCDLSTSGQSALKLPVSVVKMHGERFPTVGMFAEDACALLSLWRGGYKLTNVATARLRCRPVGEPPLARDDNHPLVLMPWADFTVILAAVYNRPTPAPATV